MQFRLSQAFVFTAILSAWLGLTVWIKPQLRSGPLEWANWLVAFVTPLFVGVIALIGSLILAGVWFLSGCVDEYLRTGKFESPKTPDEGKTQEGIVMNRNLTDITVVMDRSLSMKKVQKDAEAGLNEFINKQKAEPGDALFSLIQFDEVYEFVHRARPLREIGHCKLEPRGNTALLDALGRAITETGLRLEKMPEDQRPGLVVMVVITDGKENASKEINLAQVREMIQHQQDIYKWQFTYLGANQDAFAEASNIGIQWHAVANYDHAKPRAAYQGVHQNLSRMRHAVSRGEAVDCSYTPEERTSMGGLMAPASK